MIMRRNEFFVWILGISSLVFLSGCAGESGTAADTADVSGTVYLDDQPAPGLVVSFVGEKFAGAAPTGPDGGYQLPQGAAIGSNKVYITRAVAAGSVEEGTDAGQAVAGTELAESPRRSPDTDLPARYSDPEATELKFDVPASGTDAADFRITSE